jgi:AcrR family transcriptional regulator
VENKRRSPGLTRERVLEAAVSLVDREGLDALTMRRLAEVLGVEAMSLYRHVASKSDLLDGVHEMILGELVVPELKGPWRSVLRELARAFRRVLEAHPNAVLIFATRPAITPASVELVERVVAVLDRAGFGRDAVHAFQAGVTFVIGQTLFRLGASGDAEPSIAADEEFEYGLDALLLGLEAKRRRRR